MEKRTIESHAADALLDRRLTVNLPAPEVGEEDDPLRCPLPEGADPLPDGGDLL